MTADHPHGPEEPREQDLRSVVEAATSSSPSRSFWLGIVADRHRRKAAAAYSRVHRHRRVEPGGAGLLRPEEQRISAHPIDEQVEVL
jgi:hypothetical protein